MKWTLAVETSTRYGGIALFDEETMVHIRRFHPNQPGSEHLIPAIKEILAQESLSPSELTAIAVSVGPGSFTGLRVGLTAVKTMAYHLDVPVIPVSSLEALALSAGPQINPVAAILDARKGEIYGAFFTVSDKTIRLTDDVVMKIDHFFQLIPAQSVYIIGDGIAAYRSFLEELPATFIMAQQEKWYPSPEFVGRLAIAHEARLLTGQQLFNLTPAYLRASEAEERWEKKFGSTTP
jgi:tRNA threonylcarbamoyladenosine biosynthesis protein TsaB